VTPGAPLDRRGLPRTSISTRGTWAPEGSLAGNVFNFVWGSAVFGVSGTAKARPATRASPKKMELRVDSAKARPATRASPKDIHIHRRGPGPGNHREHWLWIFPSPGGPRKYPYPVLPGIPVARPPAVDMDLCKTRTRDARSGTYTVEAPAGDPWPGPQQFIYCAKFAREAPASLRQLPETPTAP